MGRPKQELIVVWSVTARGEKPFGVYATEKQARAEMAHLWPGREFEYRVERLEGWMWPGGLPAAVVVAENVRKLPMVTS